MEGGSKGESIHLTRRSMSASGPLIGTQALTYSNVAAQEWLGTGTEMDSRGQDLLGRMASIPYRGVEPRRSL